MQRCGWPGIAGTIIAMRWLMIAVAIAGCGTSYQPKGMTGGYSELQINARTFEVRFSGNGYTSQSAAQRGAMRRAAELTVKRGFFGFWVAHRGTSVDSSVISQPPVCGPAGCVGGSSTLVEKPDAAITIGMVTREEAASAPMGTLVYDARLILAQMGY